MRLVLDTNVVVSGVLTPMGPPGQLLDLVLAGEVRLIMDPRIAGEYHEVLLRPRFRLESEQVHSLVDALEDIALQVAALPWPVALDDQSDEIFVAAARAGDAVLVTGNIGDLPESKREGVIVRTPRECLESLRQ